jgi:hypothetical protein
MRRNSLASLLLAQIARTADEMVQSAARDAVRHGTSALEARRGTENGNGQVVA